jgi:hypothetical protein
MSGSLISGPRFAGREVSERGIWEDPGAEGVGSESLGLALGLRGLSGGRRECWEFLTGSEGLRKSYWLRVQRGLGGGGGGGGGVFGWVPAATRDLGEVILGFVGILQIGFVGVI